MSEYRFHLQKYSYGSKTVCPNCGGSRCFVRYVDEEGVVVFPDRVGKCDHEHKCGYHYTPREYFRDNPDMMDKADYSRFDRQRSFGWKITRPVPSFISPDIVSRSLSHYDINPLYHYLCNVFGVEETMRLFNMYQIGTSAKWGGTTIFWQTDVSGNVRTGKIMLYDTQTGHRIKEPQPYISWAHSELRLPDFNLQQCLFGEHLLKASASIPIMLVESEKTAVIMAHFIPDYFWLATGGKNGCFNKEAMSVLRGREVTLVPDLGAMEVWREKSALLSGICKRVAVSDVLERMATDEQREAGLDIADFFLTIPSKRQILQQMIRRNPALQLLIDEFDLALVE